MSVSATATLSKTARVWRDVGLADLPTVDMAEPYGEERWQLRRRMAVLKGWTAWGLDEYSAAVAAFQQSLEAREAWLASPSDPEDPVPAGPLSLEDAELNTWMLRHLLERRADYYQSPDHGRWPGRSLRVDPDEPGTLFELTMPDRSRESTYDETTEGALALLHHLLLLQPDQLDRMASLYYAYHPFIEPVTEMILAPIQSGSFRMGSPDDEADRYGDEVPHRVTLSHAFWMGVYPVTQQQYEDVTGDKPSRFQGSNRPVEQVSWEDAVAFCRRLTESARSAGTLPEGYEFRLPTEAEWEYCCRAGIEKATAFGDSLSSEQANFDGNHPYGGASQGPYLERTSDVGSYLPNAWGLYDMHGNVWEWCLDSAEWRDNVDTDTYVDDVVNPVCREGGYRGYRGGSWDCDGRLCRSAYRRACGPGSRLGRLGFRVCLARSPALTEP